MTQLPKGWAEATAGALCDVVGGATPRTDTAAYWGGEIPWVTPDDLSKDRRKLVDGGRRSLTQVGLESCAATLVPAGTVLFTSRAPIGYVAIASRPVATNQGFKSLTPSDALTSDFLYWQLQHLKETIRGLGSGTTFAEVSKKVMATVPLRVAPIAEQKRIVTAIEEALSKLDVGEAGLRTVRQLLKRMREAILTAAVTGRLLGDESVRAVNPEVEGDGKQPADVPGDWPTARLEDLAQFITDGDHRPPKRVAAGVPHLTAKNVRNGRLDLSGCSFVDEAGFNQTRSRYEPLQDDVIVTCVGTIGRVAVVPPGLVFSADRNLAAVRLRSGVLPNFVRVALESPGLQRRMRESSGSTAQPHLYLKDLRSITVPVPPIEEQARIVAEVERQISFVEACERAVDVGLARAAGLRRSVLKAAFEGRLVPQDPSDEPASVLLERIRAERAAQPVAKRRARQTA